jgi:ubiquinol-cytochrome c reductase subunit 7
MELLKTIQKLRAHFKVLGEKHASLMGYRSMGLLYDDLIPHDNDIVREALNRLDFAVAQERRFRLRRALALSTKKTILEESMWTKPEQVVFLI